MKRILKFLGIAICLAISVAALSSCDKMPWYHSDGNYDTADTCVVCKQLAEQIYDDIDDVLTSRAMDVEFVRTDSLWLILPDQVLSNISSVISKQGGKLTKRSIIEEYRANRNVYDNLPKVPTTTAGEPSTKEVNLSATDLGNRRDDSLVFNRSYKYRTDTINGKPVKIQIKTEESYVDQ